MVFVKNNGLERITLDTMSECVIYPNEVKSISDNVYSRVKENKILKKFFAINKLEIVNGVESVKEVKVENNVSKQTNELKKELSEKEKTITELQNEVGSLKAKLEAKAKRDKKKKEDVEEV